MSLLTAIVFAYIFCYPLPDSAYRNPGGWKFPQAEVRGFLAGAVGLLLSVAWSL